MGQCRPEGLTSVLNLQCNMTLAGHRGLCRMQVMPRHTDEQSHRSHEHCLVHLPGAPPLPPTPARALFTWAHMLSHETTAAGVGVVRGRGSGQHQSQCLSVLCCQIILPAHPAIMSRLPSSEPHREGAPFLPAAYSPLSIVAFFLPFCKQK